MPERIPDEALVVRGGQNLAENFAQGSGVSVAADERLVGVSVNAAHGMTLEQLSAANPATGYPGIPNRQVGVTTVGAIRAGGGDVVAAPTRSNPLHAVMHGLTPDEASGLFRPTRANPNRR